MEQPGVKNMDMQKSSSVNCLAAGVQVGEYRLQDVVGEGGFGIVYRARDLSLDRIVAVKEYMPSTLAGRLASNEIHVRSQHRGAFDAGLRSFINEARLLAKFSHPALVHVYRFFEENGTAYMVMRYYEGQTLRSVLTDQQHMVNEKWLSAMLAPILDALEMLHAADCYHRDIAPDNIFIQTTGVPVLLDFGAARRIIGDMTQALTMVLKPGFAPIEQYVDDGAMPQGAWTDIYQLGALLYLSITGKAPSTSVARMINDPMQVLTEQTCPGYSARFLAGIQRALAVKPQDRPQSIAEFRELLGIQTFTISLFPGSMPASAAKALEMPAAAPQAAPQAAPVALAAAQPAPQLATVGAQPPIPKTIPLAPSPNQPVPTPKPAPPKVEPPVKVVSPVVAEAPPHVKPPKVAKPAEPLKVSKPAPAAAAEAVAASDPVPADAAAPAGGRKKLAIAAAIGGLALVGALAAFMWPEGGPSGGTEVAAVQPAEPSLPAAPAPDADEQAWANVQQARTAESVQAYLAQFPNGRHRADAETLALQLANAATAESAATQPTAAAGNNAPATTPAIAPPAQPSEPVRVAMVDPARGGKQETAKADAPADNAASAKSLSGVAPAGKPDVKADLKDAKAEAKQDAKAEPKQDGKAEAKAETKPAEPLEKGKVLLKVSPWAQVQIDRTKRFTTPPVVDFELPVGEHKIEIKNPSAPPVYKTILVKKGETVEIVHKFD